MNAPAAAPVSRITPLRPPVEPASIKPRHRLVMASFLALVVGPVAALAVYLFAFAADQYASTVAFSVRKEEASSPVEFFGGITDFSLSGTSDSDILFEYIQSQEMVEKLEARLELSQIYARAKSDVLFAYKPSGTVEDLHDYWAWMVRVSYDDAAELIEVRTLAFDPQDARAISTAIFEESARLVEELSAIAQDDTIAFAKAEVDRAIERLKLAREKMMVFRSETQIVDPEADVQGQMGLLGTLQAQLAEALISADLLRESTVADDPRIKQAERRIEVIRARIDEERAKLGVGVGGEGGDYAKVLAEYERLAVDREFAQAAYTAALATYDQALAEARRKSRYLAAYIKPTLAQSSDYPKRFMLLALAGFFALSAWAIAVLIYYSIRDRR